VLGSVGSEEAVGPGVEVGLEVEDVEGCAADDDEDIFARVWRKRSKRLIRDAGFILNRLFCSSSEGSTPKASPMHWTLRNAYITGQQFTPVETTRTSYFQAFFIILLYGSILDGLVEKVDDGEDKTLLLF
jgi:hypothetical protein